MHKPVLVMTVYLLISGTFNHQVPPLHDGYGCWVNLYCNCTFMAKERADDMETQTEIDQEPELEKETTPVGTVKKTSAPLPRRGG